MRRLALLLSVATCLFAQSPADVFDQAPPEIDKALRERVAVFFQAHVDGKFRRAEQVIHEDSLDDYYNSEKTKLIKFEISKIIYSEKFTKATVITNVELDWITSRGKIRVSPPMKSLWKVDKGQWWWYAPPKGNWETPFGRMKSESESAAKAPYLTATPQSRPEPNDILNAIKASKNDVQLDSAKHSEDVVEISSELPGDVRLEVQPHGIPGLTVKFENQDVKLGKPGVIRFVYDPPDQTAKSPRIVYIHANPMSKVFSLTLSFKAPEAPSPQRFQLPAKPPTAGPKR